MLRSKKILVKINDKLIPYQVSCDFSTSLGTIDVADIESGDFSSFKSNHLSWGISLSALYSNSISNEVDNVLNLFLNQVEIDVEIIIDDNITFVKGKGFITNINMTADKLIDLSIDITGTGTFRESKTGGFTYDFSITF